MEYDNLINEAKALISNQSYEEAIEKYEEAFTINIIFDDYLDYISLLMFLKQYDKAKTALKMILFESNANIVYYYLGIIEEFQNNDADAMEYYKKSIEKDSEMIEPKYALARIYEKYSELNYAKDLYIDIIALHNDDYWAHLNLGSIYEQQDEDDKALSEFFIANEIDDQEQMSSYNIGVIYGKKKQFDLAKKYYYDELNKENPYIYTYLNLGLIFEDEENDLDKAIEIYKKGLKQDKECSVLWYNLGCIYARTGKFDEASKNYRKAFKYDKELMDYILTDEDNIEFIKSNEYLKLIGKLNKKALKST